MNDRQTKSSSPVVMRIFAKMFENQANRAPSQNERNVKLKLARKARELAKEIETAKPTHDKKDLL